VRTATVAKKRSDMKLSVVKIETTLAHRAKTIADDRGIPVSTYLSELIRAGVARDMAKITSRRLKEGSDE
jgi:hypothetical protein